MKLINIYEAEFRVDSEMDVWTRNLYALSFVSRTTGWCIGSGQVLFTQNAGDTWENFFSSAEELPYSHARRIFCKTAEECWIPGFSKSECCYTLNKGESWNVKKLRDGIYPIDIFFLDSEIGWIIGNNGSYSFNQSEISMTRDAGETWEQSFLGLFGMPVKVIFINENDGWLLDNSLINEEAEFQSNLYYTNNGGYNWKRISHFTCQVLDFIILKNNDLLIVGVEGFVSRSFDGGRTWFDKKLGDNNINSVGFFGAEIGLAICDEGIIFHTENAGESWVKFDSDIPENFVSINFTDYENGFIASSHSIYLFSL
jgi:photosystem II stability/assembly factor-like uncharacterized protein